MSAQELLSDANAAFVEDDFEGALELYNQAAECDDASHQVFSKRSACHFKLGDWEEAVKDCDKAVQMGAKAGLLASRKGQALFQLQKYEEALAAFREVAKTTPETTRFVRKCQAEIALTEGDKPKTFSVATSFRPSPTPAAAPAAAPAPVPAQQPAPVPVPAQAKGFRHEWYQSAEWVYVSIFARNLSKDDVSVEFGETELSVSIPLSDSNSWELDLQLCDAVVPDQCTFVCQTTKVEVKLRKKAMLRWESLEKQGNPIATRQWADTSKMDKRAYPSSSQKKKDWDQLDREARKVEEEEKPEGDAALQKLFQDIYSKADEDTRRAMNKSFQQSGGTVLSTNWKEVGQKQITPAPPEGMESKKFDY